VRISDLHKKKSGKRRLSTVCWFACHR